MKKILTASFVEEMKQTANDMYHFGWDERNAGNISYMLAETAVEKYLDPGHILRTIPLNFDAADLSGKIFIVTGAGKYFKNVMAGPENHLGIIRIGRDGRTAELLWGFQDGGTPTSELPAHLMSHIQRLRVNPNNRVIMHCHPTNLLALSYVHTLNERALTRTLWQMCTECILVFPDGINVLPWMICGTNEIGEATAEKMRTARLVLWAQHGIYGAGANLDEAFGLIETVEKAAEIYLKIAHLPLLNTIADAQLRQLAQHFGAAVRAGYLS